MRSRTRAAFVLALIAAIAAAQPVEAATPRWIRHIDRIVAGHPMSVMVGDDGVAWYRHGASVQRPPASNEKLLLSMALLDRFGPGTVFPVRALATGMTADGVVDGDLYLRGAGDPEVADGRLRHLVRALESAGLTHVTGDVIGLTGPFRRDWFAPGWKSYFPADYIALPTALTFRRNTSPSGVHVKDPERRAAVFVRARLRDAGVAVDGVATAGTGTSGLHTIASVDSPPLATLMRHMDRRSINFSAEVLGKALAFAATGTGSIAKAAATICAYEAAHRVTGMTCHDSSGLSYANRQTAAGIVRLLWVANRQPWAGTLKMALPDGGQGTLRGRLPHIRVRAKTGTLDNVSALSGWVWSDAAGTWIEFSLLTSGMNEWRAKDLEDRVVTVLASRAKDPTR
jgi:D-alanyl-D-alanine carboxypeptidase/D-alanyl-D-alanine-endopeptidase (penicillin-binding protein 4)